MTTDATSLFVAGADSDTVVATALSRGPWDPSSCHGGPVSALLVRTCEHVDGPPGDHWQLSRITVELTRPVPVLTPLIVRSEVERSGRNVSLVGATLTLENGTEVARARALRVRMAEVGLPDGYRQQPAFSPPGTGVATSPVFVADVVAFHRDAVDMRFSEGTWTEPGPVEIWCRLRVPVLPDETPSGAQRAAATADFSNGVSGEMDPTTTMFINPDLSVHLLRPPSGEWIGMRAESHYGPLGAGLAEGALFDEHGRCGRSVQSLFLAAR